MTVGGITAHRENGLPSESHWVHLIIVEGFFFFLFLVAIVISNKSWKILKGYSEAVILRLTDNIIAKGQNDKQWLTNHYPKNWATQANKNYWIWTQMDRKGKQFLLYLWHPSLCYCLYQLVLHLPIHSVPITIKVVRSIFVRSKVYVIRTVVWYNLSMTSGRLFPPPIKLTVVT